MYFHFLKIQSLTTVFVPIVCCTFTHLQRTIIYNVHAIICFRITFTRSNTACLFDKSTVLSVYSDCDIKNSRGDHKTYC